MIIQSHIYKGKRYNVGDELEDDSHKKWACSPVRRYGRETSPNVKDKK